MLTFEVQVFAACDQRRGGGSAAQPSNAKFLAATGPADSNHYTSHALVQLFGCMTATPAPILKICASETCLPADYNHWDHAHKLYPLFVDYGQASNRLRFCEEAGCGIECEGLLAGSAEAPRLPLHVPAAAPAAAAAAAVLHCGCQKLSWTVPVNLPGAAQREARGEGAEGEPHEKTKKTHSPCTQLGPALAAAGVLRVCCAPT